MAQTENHIIIGSVKPEEAERMGNTNPDEIKAVDVIHIRVARDEWEDVCQAWQGLHEKLRAFTHAAMAALKVSPSSRNHGAWMMFFDLYCQQISRERQAADEALYSLAYSVETGARLANFAELEGTAQEAVNE